MTEDEIAAATAICDAATPGPWIRGQVVGRCKLDHKHVGPAGMRTSSGAPMAKPGEIPCVYTYWIQAAEPVDDEDDDYYCQRSVSAPPDVALLVPGREGYSGEALSVADATFVAAARAGWPCALESLRAAMTQLAETSTECERIGQAQDRAEANERESHAENITLREEVIRLRTLLAGVCEAEEALRKRDSAENDARLTKVLGAVRDELNRS